jgi:hypothetical protein
MSEFILKRHEYIYFAPTPSSAEKPYSFLKQKVLMIK